MKKLLTLLSLVVFAIAANAFRPVTQLNLSDLHVDPSAVTKLQKIDERNRLDIANGVQRKGMIKKSFQQGHMIWDVWIINNNQRWCDVLMESDGSHPDFRDFPYYSVSLIIMAEDKNEPWSGYVTQVAWPLLWPAVCLWDMSAFQENVDWDSLNHEMVDLELLANDWNNCSSFIYDGMSDRILNDEGTEVVYWGIGSPYWITSNPIGKINGETYKYPMPTTDGTTTEPTPYVSTFQFKTYELSERYLELDAIFQLLNNEGEPVRRIVPYTGSFREEGFYPRYETGTFGDVHIVNLDTQSVVINDEKGWDDPFDFEDWGPFQKYYLMAASPDYQIVDESAEYNNDKFEYGRSLLIAPADGVTDVKDDFIIYGSLLNQFSTGNPEDFNLVYKWVEPYEAPDPWNPYNLTYSWDWHTDAGQVLPVGYDSAKYRWSGEEWAFFCRSHDYVVTLNAPSQLAVGTTDGLELYAQDQYGNIYNRVFDGDIIYHPDRNKMSKTVKLPSVGLITDVKQVQGGEEVGIIVSDNEIKVIANTDTDMAVYSLSGSIETRSRMTSGETLTVPVENGTYIVKAGKTAIKVVI